jgi:hypothetical protein
MSAFPTLTPNLSFHNACASYDLEQMKLACQTMYEKLRERTSEFTHEMFETEILGGVQCFLQVGSVTPTEILDELFEFVKELIDPTEELHHMFVRDNYSPCWQMDMQYMNQYCEPALIRERAKSRLANRLI